MSSINKDNQKGKQPTMRPKLGGNTNPKRPFNPYWVYAIILAILMGMWFFGQDNTVKEITWSEFQEYVRDNRIKSIVVYTNKVSAEAVIRDESVEHIFGNSLRAGRTPVILVKGPSPDAISEYIDLVKSEEN